MYRFSVRLDQHSQVLAPRAATFHLYRMFFALHRVTNVQLDENIVYNGSGRRQCEIADALFLGLMHVVVVRATFLPRLHSPALLSAL